MTPGTADADGVPWVAPVFYAADGYTDFYWTSSAEAEHSRRNLARRPQVSIPVFDSPGDVELERLVRIPSVSAAGLDLVNVRRSAEARNRRRQGRVLAHATALHAWEGKPPVGVAVFVEGEKETASQHLETSWPATRPCC
jgi:hypothetical protein